MYCTKCGAKLQEDACFCGMCGAKVQGAQNSGPSEKEILDQKVLESAKFLRNNTQGYYCVYCGEFIDLTKARSMGYSSCRNCGNHIVGISSGSDAGSGWGVMLINAIVNIGEDPCREIREYYLSDYYKNTGYTFEHVVLDKGLVGEYIVDRLIRKIREKNPSRHFTTYYNVLIPEPNGSFQEVDAAIVYKGCVIMVEAKNRLGRYDFKYLTEPEWELIGNGSRTQVHNPLLQNMEHMVAFQHYYQNKTGKKLSFANMYNMAFLGMMGDFNSTKDPDEFDLIVLGDKFNYCTGLILTDCIERMMDTIDEYFYSDDEILSKELNDVFAKLNSMSESEKALYLRNRQADTSDKGKRGYKYYYVELLDDSKRNVYNNFALLIRTNNLYVQYLDGDNDYWMQDDKFYIENGEVKNDALGEIELKDLMNLPLNVVNALGCVEGKEVYFDF